MIVTDVDKKHPLDDGLAGQADGAGASSSHMHVQVDDFAAPPPDGEAPKYTERAFENVYIPPGGEEPPPEFTPYEAEYFISGKEVVSHDPHLNEDGEALYRFLLSQSATPPEYRMHLRGTHTEHRTRFVTRTDSKGDTITETEHYTENVTDFDFYIDLTSNIVHGPVHWSLPDAEPAYRGEMVKQVDSNDLVTRDPEIALPSGRRKATKEEIKAAKARKETRTACGLPPWVAVGPESWLQQQTPERAVVLESSKSLRQWADEYCASDKLLKEFTYTKIVYGWNVSNLREAVVAAIRSVYRHDIFVTYDMSHNKIHIRPANKFSRMLSNMWIKFLLWILLIYPFIWLYKRFNQRGGGRWEVCGGAYALKTWQIQPPGTQMPMYTNDGRWQQTPDGVVHLIGEREGEWFQRWEGAIRDAVTRKIRTQVPLQCGTYVSPQAMILDGFRPTLPYVSPPIPR